MNGPEKDSLLRAFAVGLRTAQGARLIDVLGIIRFKLEQLNDTPEEVIAYERSLVPILLTMIGNPATNLGLRGAVVQTLAVLGVQLEQIRTEQSAKFSRVMSLRRLILRGFATCLERPTGLPGLLAIAAALNEFEPTIEVLELIRRMLAHDARSLHSAISERLRGLA